MKYIRTKDAIYKVRKPALDEYLWEDSTYVYGHEHIKNSEILARADTIEELCDCFIGKVSDEEYIHLIGLWEKKHYSAIKEVYGAIWTKKGLIYSAKLNEKGELVLL